MFPLQEHVVVILKKQWEKSTGKQWGPLRTQQTNRGNCKSPSVGSGASPGEGARYPKGLGEVSPWGRQQQQVLGSRLGATLGKSAPVPHTPPTWGKGGGETWVSSWIEKESGGGGAVLPMSIYRCHNAGCQNSEGCGARTRSVLSGWAIRTGPQVQAHAQVFLT